MRWTYANAMRFWQWYAKQRYPKYPWKLSYYPEYPVSIYPREMEQDSDI